MSKDEYSLGPKATAESVYLELSSRRQGVIDTGRKMAELTIISIMPPVGYEVGDDLPGNNQSVGARCVNNLASVLMFMAFPPGQPICRFEAVEYNIQEQVTQDPEMWSKTLLGLSRLELAHRKRIATTSLATAYVGYLKALLVTGNALWKHIKLNQPAYHRPDCYVVRRDASGHPLLTIHKETISLMALDEDTRAEVFALLDDNAKKVFEQKAWETEVDIYSVCKLKVGKTDSSWCYWQEYKGHTLSGTDVETDYDTPPMYPGWLIPVYGKNWGPSYCEEYRGDLYTMEAHASAVNDGAALAALALIGVKPGSTTNIKQVREARNLTVLPADFENDVSVFRSEKGGDMNFVVNNMETTARRLAAAFLLQVGVQRQAERVTKEEVQRVGGELDKALGGLYTQIAQGNQRTILLRAFRLHEDENKNLPVLPKGVVEVQVVTGIDALGNTSDYENLKEWAADAIMAFPKTFEAKVNGGDYLIRTAAAKGIKPDGLIKTDQQVQADMAQQKQDSMMQSLVDKGTGPAITGLAGALQQQQQPAPQGGQSPA